MATKKKAVKKAAKKPSDTVTLKLTRDEANKLYDFVNVAHIRAGGKVEVATASRDVLEGSDIDEVIFDALTAAGITGDKSHSL